MLQNSWGVFFVFFLILRVRAYVSNTGTEILTNAKERSVKAAISKPKIFRVILIGGILKSTFLILAVRNSKLADYSSHNISQKDYVRIRTRLENVIRGGVASFIISIY